jgi:hypothetical protein
MKREWIAAIALSISAQAKPPGFDHVFPAGGKAGTTVEVSIAGSGLDKVQPTAWSTHPGIAFTPAEKAKHYRVSIAADVQPGPYLVRFITSEGATHPRIFVVGTLDEQLEGQPAKPNTTINGVLAKGGEVDTHSIQVKKGQRIALDVAGYALGSSMDPALRLLNARGVEIATSHDTRNLDPHLSYTAQADGIVQAQVMAFAHPPAADVALKGGASHIYRLTIADDPARKPTVEPDHVKLGDRIEGLLAKPTEEDRYQLSAKKGDTFVLHVRGLGHSPIDATLRIDDARGKTLQQADDGDKDSPDPLLSWTAKADGTYTLIIADRYQQGSAEHRYELSVQAPQSTIRATLDAHRYVVKAGDSVEVKLTVKLSGKFTEKLTARPMQLAPGLTMAPVEMPAKGGDVKLKLTAAKDSAGSATPIIIGVCHGAQCTLAEYALPFEEPRGDLLIMRDAQPWISVTK